MMETIELLRIEKNKNEVLYNFQVTDGLRSFFSDRPFVIEYSENVERVPEAVTAIPFVCNVLPIIWLTNSILIVPKLDEAFYNCISEVKKGYEDMYPETEFKGEIKVERIIPNDQPSIPGRCAMFYSGGVDSLDTLYRHIDEKPLLVSIWGSDIQYDNESGWQILRKVLNEAADCYCLDIAVIRSRFREFDNEIELSRSFSNTLQRNYWYGIKHALGLLGHISILAYLHSLSVFYIASSNCPADGKVRTASDPRIDNYVRFVSCQVIHDGFESSRQDKLKNIVQFSEKNRRIIPLHVCWETKTGTNCCKCEKCYRTITGLILENVDPKEYGFPDAAKELPYMHERMVLGRNHAPKSWDRLHKDVVARVERLKNNPYWKYIDWLTTADFFTPGALKMPLAWRIRTELSRNGFYRYLSKIKRKIMGKEKEK